MAVTSVARWLTGATVGYPYGVIDQGGHIQLHPVRVLPSDPRAVRGARTWVREIAGTCFTGRPARLGDIELAVSELVTNAVEHGTGDAIQVAVDVSDTFLAVEVASVSDRSGVASPATWRPAPADRVSGRGLHIVASVSDRVEVVDDPPRTVVRCWFGR